MGISHPAIEWSPSQQDDRSSPFRREMLPGSAAASRFAAGNPAGPGSPHPPLGTCSPSLGWGKVTSAAITFWFQEKEGVLIFFFFFPGKAV